METNNETQRVIENLTDLFKGMINEKEFLIPVENQKHFIRRIEDAFKMVATQKAIDIKNSISTLNI